MFILFDLLVIVNLFTVGDGIGYFNGVILHRMCNFKIKLCKIKTGNV